jgi:DNA-directed RNA polymerase alpha subunit
MELSVRTLNVLRWFNIRTVGQLIVIKKDDLIKRKNFGQKSFIELRDVLADYGYSPWE